MDINQNYAACIEHTNNFGSTVVHNICNGTTQVVPWGSVDWACSIGAVSVAALVVLFMGSLVFAVLGDL